LTGNGQIHEDSGVGTPPAEHPVTTDLVRALLRAQHPDLAGLELSLLGEGWDNNMYRLGDELTVRIPRRAIAAELMANELKWLPVLAKDLPIVAPVPVRDGRPGLGYPWPWAVLPWLDGETANLAPPKESEAERLADCLRFLHRPAPMNAPGNEVRGVPLQKRFEAVESRLRRLRRNTDAVTLAVERAWREGLEAEISNAWLWLHGDLHGQNVLVSNGRLSALIDWGDLCAGDPASDLSAFWLLFDNAEARRRGLARYGASAADIARARGWAVMYGAVFLDTGRQDNPAHAAMGEAVLRRLTEEG
jgi:aminoglycoside phosphotransferase (APT) family kinase protein